MDIKRFAICGVPKSGTKLMNHMLHVGLPTWDYTPQERSIFGFSYRDNVITKKPKDVFSLTQIKAIENTFVIVMYRDPLMVLTSKHRSSDYWITADKIGNKQPAPIKWYRKILEAKTQMSGNMLIVSYEELTDNPDRIQRELTGLTGIKFHRDFSQFVNFPLDERWQYLNIIKPLERRSLKIQDLAHLGAQLKKCPELLEIRKKLGYEDESFDLS